MPTNPQAAAKSTAPLAEKKPTNSATSIGPAMNTSSISTASSEYAAASNASSMSARLR